MHGYNQMIMCGDDNLSKEFIEKATLEIPYISQAKNYLNSCEPNAILFSYGDNDTYQLWYVQEKYNFRKDVQVINYSLLGLPIYIDLLKRKKILAVNMPASFLKEQYSDVAYFTENKNTDYSKKTIPIQEFLSAVYNKKFLPVETNIADYPAYPSYPYSAASLSIPINAGKSLDKTVNKNILFNLNKTYFISDLVVFDIIQNNIQKHPVYFTTNAGLPFENHLMQKGIVYKLIAEDIDNPLQKNLEIKGLEKFINEKYLPVLSDDSSLISFDGDNTFFRIYYRLFNYYLTKKDTVNFKKWLYRLDATCPKINSTQINVAKSLAYYFIEAGDTKKGIMIMDQFYEWLNQAYSKPTSLTGYYSKTSYTTELKNAKEYLTSKNLNSDLINRLLENVEE